MSRYDSFGLNGYQQLNDARGDVEKLKHMIDAMGTLAMERIKKQYANMLTKTVLLFDVCDA